MAKHKATVPVFDDLGNPVEGGFKQRTFERRHGCWNCKGFETGEVYTKRATDLRFAEVRAGVGMGLSPEDATDRADAMFRVLVDRRGAIGLCMKGQVQSDLVAARHMCGAWEGRSELPEDVKRNIDDPVEALYDNLGETPEGESK